jgi:hypothetical protein
MCRYGEQVLESKGETEQALDRCKEALNIFIGRSDSETSEMAQLHAQMGVLYRAISEDDLAQYHLKRCAIPRCFCSSFLLSAVV